MASMIERLGVAVNRSTVVATQYGMQKGDYIDASKANGTIFEMRSSPGKGRGLFALQDIPRGSCIFAEKPLVALNLQCDIFEEMGKLSTAERESFDALTYHMSNVDLRLPNFRDMARRNRAAAGKTGAELERAVDDCMKTQAIFMTNSVRMNSDTDGGVFLTYSRVNHSCTPNVNNGWNPTLGKGTLFAIRDIKKSEELLTTYIDPLATRAQRAVQLKAWGIECNCKACRDDDGTRELVLELYQALEASYDMMGPTPGHLPSIDPTSHDDAAVPFKDMPWDSLKRTFAGMVVDSCEQIVQLLQDEGLTGMVLGAAYRTSAKYRVRLGRIEEAKVLAAKEIEIETVCLGSERSHLGDTGAVTWLKRFAELAAGSKPPSNVAEEEGPIDGVIKKADDRHKI